LLISQKKIIRLFFVCLIVFALIPNLNIHAEINEFSEIDTSVLFITELTTNSFGLIKQYLNEGRIEDAKTLSQINTEVFPLHLQNLRESNPVITDEIHIMLLDIHNGIGNMDNSQLIEDISKVENLLNQYTITNPNYGKSIALILSLVDEQYQIAITEENSASYDLSIVLIDRSHKLFLNTTFDDRLNLELNSFLAELKEKVENKDDFVSVGTLITAISRDFVGSETIVYDKQKIYDTIRTLYQKLLVSIDAGDYSTAEELAIEAYLDNFEYLEADIEKVDSELLYVLEIDMREELRSMIKNQQNPKISL